MERLLGLTLNGVTYGMIYAAVAMGLVLIWRATRVINFAQGAMAMFTTYVAITLIGQGVSYWIAFGVALLLGLAMGAAVELALIRPLRGRFELSPVIVTLGLLILLEGVAGVLWGGGDRGFPAAFSQIGLVVGGQRLAFSRFDAFTVAVVLFLMLLILGLFRGTNLGLRMRASAFAPEVARLLGVRVGRILTLGWALAALAGSLAGILVAPKVLLFPNNMDEVLIFGFTGAVMGGLDSPLGALVGGLVTGLVLSYVGGFLGSSLETVGALVMLLVVLSIRPQGIFSRASLRRV
ncbi:MAG: branched-chain amino acid ABC transporter permease [Candidatus Dormibacteraceae bacterium]